jgi:hypothetical protein
MQTQFLENGLIEQPLLVRHSLSVANFNTMGSTNFTDASARRDRELSYQVQTEVHTEVNDSHSIDSENKIIEF